MLALRVVPKIYYFDTFKEFNEEFSIGEKDLLVTNEWMFTPYVKPLNIKTNVVFQEKYGKGEP
ncbi:MAG: 4-hydroxybutyrate dehydrogenase, partial [Clostridia bacterium]|nr:4-hydroxybutyrate dehydrogenase [Clostridia bacterium]